MMFTHRTFIPSVRAAVLLLFPAFFSIPAQNKELRVFISVDMEGVAGVVNDAQLAPGGFEYEKFRRLMTAEANAAIEGAYAAGATQVTVADSHGNGLSLLPDELNPKVRLIRSWPRPLITMEGIERGFDAAILIGYHAAIGTPGAVRAHTMSSKRFYDVRLNGRHAGETMLSAAIAGHFGVPVVLVSGDDKTLAEVHKTIDPKITGAVVKRGIGYHSAESISPREARALITAQVKIALAKIGEVKPFTLAKPVKLEIAFKNMMNAEILSLLPNVERVDGATIRFTGKDIVETTRFLEFVSQYNNAD